MLGQLRPSELVTGCHELASRYDWSSQPDQLL
jgi:hypothetical protein